MAAERHARFLGYRVVHTGSQVALQPKGAEDREGYGAYTWCRMPLPVEAHATFSSRAAAERAIVLAQADDLAPRVPLHELEVQRAFAGVGKNLGRAGFEDEPSTVDVARVSLRALLSPLTERLRHRAAGARALVEAGGTTDMSRLLMSGKHQGLTLALEMLESALTAREDQADVR